jgi:hypothetical protein
MTELCIGYCDPTNEGKHPHPEWPADLICDECFLGAWEEWLQERLAVAIDAIGEKETKQIIEDFL